MTKSFGGSIKENKKYSQSRQPITTSASLTSPCPPDISSGVKYEPLLHIVLFQPEIPPNTGNIGRTCVAVGAKLWLVRPLGFILDDKHLRRAGMDYWEHLEVEVVDDWPQLVARLPAPRIWFFSRWAERTYFDVAFERGDALVFGSESAGLPAEILAEHKERLIKLPTRPQVRSLNLSSCVCAATYEAVRQLGGVTR